MLDTAFEEAQTETAAEASGVCGMLAGQHVVLRVRHEAEHHAGGITHASDVGDGAVRIHGVSQRDLTSAVE
jgi:hypothetical protein